MSVLNRNGVRLLLTSLGLVLGGCVFAPGQHVSPSAGLVEDEAHAGVEVVVQPITADLIAAQNPDASRAALPTELLAYQPAMYRLGAGDVINVTVWEHPELTVPVAGAVTNPEANGRLIRKDGTFFFPYAGTVEAAGKTIDEVRSVLTQRLAKYISSPQIDINVTRFNSQRVFFTGAFQRAQPQSITAVPLSLADALGNAGPDPLSADLSSLTLLRGGVSHRLDLDALARQGADLSRLFLMAGDQLHMPFVERKKVYVMGEVNLVRSLTFRLGFMTLADALQQSGGVRQETSKVSAIHVLRERPRAPDAYRVVDVFTLNANAVESLVLSDKFALLPGDVVYVSSAGITRWNRFVSQLFPSASLITTTNNIRNNN